MYDHVMVFWTLDGLLSTMQEQSLMSECCFVVLCREKKQCIKLTLLFQLRSHFTKQQSADTTIIFLTDPKPTPTPTPQAPKKTQPNPVDSPMPKVLDSFPKIDGGLGQPGESSLVSRGPHKVTKFQSPQNKENLRVPNGWSKQPTTVNRSELKLVAFFFACYIFWGDIISVVVF